MLLRRREYPDSLFSHIQNPPEQQKNKQKINKGVNSDVLSCPHALGPPCVTHHRKPRLLLLLGLVRSESHLEQVRRRRGGGSLHRRCGPIPSLPQPCLPSLPRSSSQPAVAAAAAAAVMTGCLCWLGSAAPTTPPGRLAQSLQEGTRRVRRRRRRSLRGG